LSHFDSLADAARGLNSATLMPHERSKRSRSATNSLWQPLGCCRGCKAVAQRASYCRSFCQKCSRHMVSKIASKPWLTEVTAEVSAKKGLANQKERVSSYFDANSNTWQHVSNQFNAPAMLLNVRIDP
jgi:hypothetical protein